MDEARNVVVVGGGVAGLEIATALGRRRGGRRHRGLSVTLVDREYAHVWKPMLHTIAAGTRDVAQQQTTFIGHARDAGFAYQPGELCGLERGAREILLAPLHAADGRLLVPARRLRYDTLVLALGSQANDFGTPGVDRHCYRIDSRRQADAFSSELRIRMLQCLAQDAALSIAIVGGGATGVELAAELVQLVHTAVAHGAHGLDSRISVTLVEAGPRLLAGFPEDISSATRGRLESLGIQVMTDAQVAAADADGFVLEGGDRVDASLRVWAAGVKGADVLSDLDGLEATRGHQLVVRQTLQTTRDPDVYAVGDCASLVPPGRDRPLPPTAQVAHQQAKYLVRALPATLRGDAVEDFAYRDLGMLVSLGEYDAYGSLGQFGLFDGVTIRGRLAQFGHVMLYRRHQTRIHGFWRGSLLWLVDRVNSRLRMPVGLD